MNKNSPKKRELKDEYREAQWEFFLQKGLAGQINSALKILYSIFTVTHNFYILHYCSLKFVKLLCRLLLLMFLFSDAWQPTHSVFPSALTWELSSIYTFHLSLCKRVCIHRHKYMRSAVGKWKQTAPDQDKIAPIYLKEKAIIQLIS